MKDFVFKLNVEDFADYKFVSESNGELIKDSARYLKEFCAEKLNNGDLYITSYPENEFLGYLRDTN